MLSREDYIVKFKHYAKSYFEIEAFAVYWGQGISSSDWGEQLTNRRAAELVAQFAGFDKETVSRLIDESHDEVYRAYWPSGETPEFGGGHRSETGSLTIEVGTTDEN